jgi:hypothetical protein
MLPQVPTVKRPSLDTSEFEKIIFTDFSGGLNTADPKASIRDNQFTSMMNYEINENKTLSTRKPYKPWNNVSGNTDVTNDTVYDILGTTKNTYDTGSVVLKRFFMFEVQNNSSETEDAVFVTYTYAESSTAYWGVARWDDDETVWAEISGSIPAAVDDVRLVKMSVNNADDILIMPVGGGVMQRYTASKSTPDVSSLGLTVPDLYPYHADDNPFGIAMSALGESDYTGNQGIAEIGTLYYKVSYFYDDSNVSTLYGESPTSNTREGDALLEITLTAAAADKQRQVDFVWDDDKLPSNITKMIFYRSPIDNPAGPYRMIGEAVPSEEEYTDSRPIDFEGAEDLPDGSNPTDESVRVSNPSVINGIVFGFEDGMSNKLIYSLQGNPDAWNPLNYAYLEDEGKGVAMFGANLYVFDKSNIYQIANGDVFNNDPLRISRGTCVSGDTIVDIGTGLMWLGYDDIYWANFNTFNNEGDYPIRFGKSIRNLPMSMHPSNGHLAVAGYNDDKYTLCIPANRDTKNNTTITLDRFGGGWAQVSYTCSFMQVYKEVLYTSKPEGSTIREHGVSGSTDYESYAESNGDMTMTVIAADVVDGTATVDIKNSYDGVNFSKWRARADLIDPLNPGDPEDPNLVEGVQAYHDVADSTEGLLAYWKFDEPTNTTTVFADETGRHDGSVTGGNLITATGKFDRAISVWNTRVITVAPHSDFEFGENTDFSITGWVVQQNTGFVVLDHYTAGVGGWIVDVIGTKLRFTMTDGTTTVSMTADDVLPGPATCFTVSIDRDGTGIMYINGEAQAQTVNASTVGSVSNASKGLLFNQGIGGNHDLDDLRVYSFAMSETQHDALWNSGTGSMEFLGETIDGQITIGSKVTVSNNTAITSGEYEIITAVDVDITEDPEVVRVTFLVPDDDGTFDSGAIVQLFSGKQIATELQSKLMHFGHEFRETILSSLGMIAESTGSVVTVTIFANNKEYSSVLNFNFGGTAGVNAQTSGFMVWGHNNWSETDWHGISKQYFSMHKKAKRGLKAKDFQIKITSPDARDTDILASTIYFRRLQPPA